MKNNALALLLLLCLLAAHRSHAQNEPFVFSELNLRPGGAGNYRLAHPFEILHGPDNHLYITEKIGRVLRVDTGTGVRRVILDHRNNVSLHINRNGSGAATGIGQDGMLGMALHPDFGMGTGKDSVFLAYTYADGLLRISRFGYTGGANPSLHGETILLGGIPASNDHSSGRLAVGPDNKLYYSCGDLGANQFGNRCQPIRSQNDPTAAQISLANYAQYSGKILRINFDGSVPVDNPVFNGVRSHVFSKGHRNPQGLVWELAASAGTTPRTLLAGGRLFSSEHGPRTDDEINLIEPGRNYGWPFIAGDTDNVNYQYVNWSSSTSCAATPYSENAVPPGATILQEDDAPASVTANFRKPIQSMYASCGAQSTLLCDASGTNAMRFATIAPASLDFYHVNGGLGIPDWYPSLLIPTLKKGTLYRVKMNASRDAMITDTIPYFTSFNRYRDIAVSPDGTRIYIITDSIGSTSGPTASGTSSLANRGAILVYTFNNVLLKGRKPVQQITPATEAKVYPNPVSDLLYVQLPSLPGRPLNFQLCDPAGRVVRRGESRQSSFTVNISGLAPQVYILRIKDAYGVERLLQKVVVKH